MHPCLENTELRDLIFGLFSYEASKSSLSMGTLASLASTCKAFVDPALDVLWKDQPSLVPLLKVMPEDLWNFEDDTLTFTRALSESDWSRSDYYGKKIRALGYGIFEHEMPTACRKLRTASIDREVLIAVLTYRPIHPMLPNLHTITFCFKTETDDLRFFQALLGASLKNVTLSKPAVGVNADSVSQLLLSLSRTSPAIEQLALHDNSPLPDVYYSALNHLLLQLNNVRILSVFMIPSPQAVLHLGKLISLKEWSRVVVSSTNQARLTSEGARFPNLSDFHVITGDLTTATSTIESMACSFESLKISCTFSTQAKFHHSSLRRLMDVLEPHPCVGFLRRLDLVLVKKPESATKEPLAELLRPLFSLRMIETIRVPMNIIDELDDSWLREASVAWPSLEFLSIGPQKPDEDEVVSRMKPNMSLAGLIPLVKNCPKLFYLKLSLMLEPFDVSLLPGVYNLNVETVQFAYSPVTPPTDQSNKPQKHRKESAHGNKAAYVQDATVLSVDGKGVGRSI